MNAVVIKEVGPRDGLQNEKENIPTAIKAEFIAALRKSGLKYIEITSFVRADRIAQLADATELVALLKERGLWDHPESYSALVPNRRGLDQALEAGLQEIAVFTAASDAFTQKNTNCTIEESLQRIAEIMSVAIPAGVRVRGYISTVVECPYIGKIKPEQVRSVALPLLEMGVYEISLGETIGVAVPDEIAALLDCLLEDIPAHRLAGHYHDTRGTALLNVFRSLQYGLTTFDSSAGGLGGCPYAPGAAGNLATEALVYALERSGYRTGVSLPDLREATGKVQGFVSRPLQMI
ncbi:MAG: hydroxymethylglutaryl-CoA lyase [Spirochaetales bacterium]|nr:hydroxymethylglutaryl-CoA lyase [Spirochaetales bacterium]